MARAEAAVLGDLPDVNVWLALLNATHAHHARARAYWEGEAALRMAFCRISMLGLLRLSTNKLVMGGAPYTTAQAWQAYGSLRQLPEVFFAAEPLGLDAAMQHVTQTPAFRPADWTDAYLAAFARLAQLRLVTFDKGLARLTYTARLTL